MSTIGKPGAGIQSLETGIGIFQTLCQIGRPVPLTELAATVRMHPAKLHRYLASLVRTGLVEQNASRLYGPGAYAFRLRNDDSVIAQASGLALEMLPALARRIGESVFLSRWGRTGPLILKTEEPPKTISVRPTATGDLPLATSASGRAFAAWMDQKKLAPLLDAELKAAGRPAQRSALSRQLAETRRRGLARSLGERYPGVNAFSAPVFDSKGGVILALTAFGLVPTFSSAWDGPVAKALAAAAADLTRRIGGHVPGSR